LLRAAAVMRRGAAPGLKRPVGAGYEPAVVILPARLSNQVLIAVPKLPVATSTTMAMVAIRRPYSTTSWPSSSRTNRLTSCIPWRSPYGSTGWLRNPRQLGWSSRRGSSSGLPHGDRASAKRFLWAAPTAEPEPSRALCRPRWLLPSIPDVQRSAALATVERRVTWGRHVDERCASPLSFRYGGLDGDAEQLARAPKLLDGLGSADDGNGVPGGEAPAAEPAARPRTRSDVG